jgi:hypothetical protein
MRCEEARTLADSIGEAHAATRDALCRALDERSDVLKLFEADKRRVKKTPEARGARGTTLDSTDDDDEDEDEDEDDAAAPRPTDSSIRHLGLFGEDDEDDEEEEDDDEEEVEAGDDEEEDDDEEGTPAPKRRRVEPDSEESD